MMSGSAASTHTSSSTPEAHGHVAPLREYLIVFAVLMALLAATVGAALIDFGRWGVFLAYSIAVAKGLLIVTYFMHLKGATKLTWVFAAAPFLWVTILLVYTFNDYRARKLYDTAEPMTHLLDPRPRPGLPGGGDVPSH